VIKYVPVIVRLLTSIRNISLNSTNRLEIKNGHGLFGKHGRFTNILDEEANSSVVRSVFIKHL
jgi:hypothetical protein